MPDKTPNSVSGFYDGIFHYYGAANAFMTLGLDARWRREAAKLALASNPAIILDVCCGTGDMTLALSGLSKGRAVVTGADFNRSMLDKARARDGSIRFLEAEAGKLPFPDGAFDTLTISFATRNLLSAKGLDGYFREFRRVLKPGGAFINLETSQPGNRLIRLLFHAHARLMTILISLLCPRTKAAYNFLAETISSFYSPEELSEIIIKAGFSSVEVRPFMFGAIAVHKAIR